MKFSRYRIGLATLGIALMVTLTASATTVMHMEVEDMAPMAAVVLIGEVNQVQASWNAEKTKIHTRVLISPTEVLKGDKGLGTVLVKTIGGQVGNTVAEVSGAPKFVVGERVLVFLEPRKDGDGYLTLGFYQGKFKVFNDPASGREMIVRDVPARGVSALAKTASTPINQVRSLDDVRALLSGGAK